MELQRCDTRPVGCWCSVSREVYRGGGGRLGWAKGGGCCWNSCTGGGVVVERS